MMGPSGMFVATILLIGLNVKFSSGSCKTVDDQSCIFPFESKGKTYNGCTDDQDTGKFWCRTRLVTSESGKKRNWGYCQTNCKVTAVHDGFVTDGGALGDKRCHEGEICMGKTACPDYTRYKEKKFAPGETKAALLRTLKRKVCKKKPNRLCCQLGNPSPPTNDDDDDDDDDDRCKERTRSFSKSFLPRKDQCGLSCSGSKNVVFGKNAKLGEYPWAALVGSERIIKTFNNIKKRDEDVTFTLYHCGGTLINTWFVVTAAHCHTSQDTIVKVVLGEWDVQTNPDCTDGQNCDNPKIQVRGVENVLVHNGYDKSRSINDIALVKLASEAQLNRFVQLACLPLPEYALPTFFHNPEGRSATVTGWGSSGRTDDDIKRNYGVATARLQKGRVEIQPIEECNKAYRRNTLTTSQLCAGGGRDHTDSCNGDSGGGLMIDSGKYLGQSEGNVHVLVGVVSYGSRLCGDSPSVYTKVDQFIPWIKENIK